MIKILCGTSIVSIAVIRNLMNARTLDLELLTIVFILHAYSILMQSIICSVPLIMHVILLLFFRHPVLLYVLIVLPYLTTSNLDISTDTSSMHLHQTLQRLLSSRQHLQVRLASSYFTAKILPK